MPSPPTQPILIIMGVSGSGKSTVAALLARRLGWELLEGDDLHPAQNVAKMAAGQPLTDDDRRPWLEQLAARIDGHTRAGTPAIVTCSALRRAYRDRLRGENVVFVHLAGSKDVIARRLAARTGHYMPAALLDSQLDTLEPPEPDEAILVVPVHHGAAEIAAQIVVQLDLRADRSSPASGAAGTEVRATVRA